MNFADIQSRALEIRRLYEILEEKKYSKKWTREQIAEGFVGDVGDLLKLVLAKSGVRDIEDVDQKLAHELSDCLWAIMVLSEKYGIDLEKIFLENMSQLEEKVRLKIAE